MPRRLLILPTVLLAAATGCQQLPALTGLTRPTDQPPTGQPPVIVIPEPQIAVPVPLAPGETLVDPNQPKPFFAPPGVALPPQSTLPTPRATSPAPPPQAAGLLDRISDGAGAISPSFGLPRAPVVENRLPNPLVIPIRNAELAWDEMADVVSDFFPIAREQPVQTLDGVVTAGFIESAPQVGATIFEPQRPDSVGRFNRWESTFQTIRRRAVVNVTPTAQGYAIGVQSFKEIEDLPQPLGATAGVASLRNDQALPSGRLTNDFRNRTSNRWLPLGRDEPLEQELLARIQQRLTGVAPGVQR